jgi:hypothetical protein
MQDDDVPIPLDLLGAVALGGYWVFRRRRAAKSGSN